MPSTDTEAETTERGPTADATPVTDLAGTDVYAAGGVRVGRVVDLVVDPEAGVATGLVLDDVAAAAVGPLPEGVDRVRIPYRLVRDGGDVVVLSVETADDSGAGAPHGGTGGGPAGTDGAVDEEPDDGSTRGVPTEDGATDDGDGTVAE